MCAYVVLADDDPKQADLFRRYLEREGHAVGVVHDGRAALDGIRRQWPVVFPPSALVAGVLGAVVVGMAAGVYPAVRASGLPPTEALAAV